MDRENLDVDHYTNTYYFVKLLLYFISLFSCFEKKTPMVILAPSSGFAAR